MRDLTATEHLTMGDDGDVWRLPADDGRYVGHVETLEWDARRFEDEPEWFEGERDRLRDAWSRHLQREVNHVDVRL